MTSNMGSSLIRENFEKITPENKEETIEKTKAEVLNLLKQTIRPEFLNRIDEIIMFAPLNESEIKDIVVIQLNNIRKTLEQNDIQLQFTDSAINFIANEGYDPQFGARPVKRVIQRYILNHLSKAILSHTVNREKPIIIDKQGEELTFRN